MALLVTPIPPNDVRVTCSCGFLYCRVNGTPLAVVAMAVAEMDVTHECRP